MKAADHFSPVCMQAPTDTQGNAWREGHVPVSAINKLLAKRPNIKGISLPGMPEGSPGMTGRKTEPFIIYEVSDGEAKVFAVE